MNETQKSSRMGLVLGVICNGQVPVRWMMHQQNLHKSIPSGMFWTYVYAIGDFKKDPTKNYASLRTEVVEAAKKQNCKWLLFIDSDVFIPMDGINRMFRQNADIVTGVYWMKTYPPQPVIYEEIGNGPLWDITPSDKAIEIGGAGLGCTLVKMDVFDKFDEMKIPYFKQDWEFIRKDGRKIQVDIGEDHWFFHQARELGFKIMCDTYVLCDHLDINTDVMYPGDTVVKEIAEKKLASTPQGKAILEQQKVTANIDKEKPTIVFFNANTVKFDGESIAKKPISGSETAVIQMAKSMRGLGWNVHVFCNTDREGIFDSVSYHHFKDISPRLKQITDILGENIDVFVSSRDTRPLNGGRPPARNTILWCHDMPGGGNYADIPKTIPFTDYFMFVSKFQADKYKEMYNIPDEKIIVTRNAVDADRFKERPENKVKGRCIYSTTPFRGLDVLLGMWPEIKRQIPHATLYIYSGMSIYDAPETPETSSIFELAEKMAHLGVVLNEPITQGILAKEIMRAEVMLYPSTFTETSCISAIEAQVASTPIITTRDGALPETVKDRGVLIDGDPYSDEYQKKFIDEAVKMLTDDSYRTSFIGANDKFRWSDVALEWAEIFRGREGTQNVKVRLMENGKYNYNTSDFWNKRYKFDHRHSCAPIGEVERYADVIKHIPQDASIMEVGCGMGNFAEYLHKNNIGSSFQGFDITEYAIEKARKLVPTAKFMQISEDPMYLPASDVDVLTCFHTLEHLEYPEKYVQKWISSVRKGGRVIFIIPYKDDDYQQHIEIWDDARVKRLMDDIGLPNYESYLRPQGWNYQSDGRKAEEMVIIANL